MCRKKVLGLLVILGAAAAAAWHFDVWNRHIWPRLGGPAARATSPDAAAGNPVRGEGKVVEVRRPVGGGAPKLLVREGDALVTVEFPPEADAALLGLSRGDVVRYEGTLASKPGEDPLVTGARLLD